eukprot:jgi/Picsp_1/6740/NSC_04081-R1_ubiquitin carboxyl-terminal hydrolase 24
MEENEDQRDGTWVDEKVDEMAKHGDRERTDGSEEDKGEDVRGETCATKDSGGGGKSIANRSEEKEGREQTDGVVATGTGSGDADAEDRPTSAVSGDAGDRPTGTASTTSAPQQGENGDGDDGTVGEEDAGSGHGYGIDVPECVRIVESLREVDNITQVSYSDVLKVQSYMEFYFDTMIREKGRGNDETFEQYVVRPLLTDILPSIYHSALGNDFLSVGYDASSLVIVTARFFGLVAVLLHARILETTLFEPTMSNYLFDEMRKCFGVLSYAMHPGCVFLNTCNQAAINLGGIISDERVSEWVAVEFFTIYGQKGGLGVKAIFLDHFAARHGIDNVVTSLRFPDRLQIPGCDLLVQFLQIVSPFVCISRKRDMKLGIDAMYNYLDSQFDDKAILENLGQHHISLCSLIRTLAPTSTAFGVDASEVESKVSKYQRQIIVALFGSGNVSQQLAAVKELNSIAVHCILDGNLRMPDRDGSGLPVRLEWIRTDKIISVMLESNLHHSQYIEDVKEALQSLILYGLVTEEHIKYLWKIMEDENTFEEIKINICQLLGSLASNLPAEQGLGILSRLEGKSVSLANLKYFSEMLKSVSKSDTKGALMGRVLQCALRLALNEELSSDSVSLSLLTDLCTSYQNLESLKTILGDIVTFCLSLLAGEQEDVLRPVQILLLLLDQDKFGKGYVFEMYKRINTDSSFLESIMKSYTKFLNTRLLDLHMSSRAEELVEHYNSLIKEVINESNYYTSQDQMLQILNWTNPSFGEQVSSSAWNLLTSLVQEEKGVQKDSLNSFFKKYLLEINFNLITRPAWQCITAHMAALVNWEVRLPKLPGPYSVFINANKRNQSSSLWLVILNVLSDMVTFSPDESSGEASKLFARLYAELLRVVEATDGLLSYMDLYITRVKRSFEDSARAVFQVEVSGLSWNPIMKLVSDSAFPLKRLHRIIDHLLELSIVSAWDPLGSERPSEASYRDISSRFSVTFQHMPFQDVSHGEKRIVKSIECPSNALVGDLRQIISQEVSALAGVEVPRQHIRLLSGGKEASEDGQSLDNSPLQTSTMAVFSSQPYDLGFQPSSNNISIPGLLSQDDIFISILLALGQCDMIPDLSVALKAKLGLLSISATKLILRLPKNKAFEESIKNKILNGDISRILKCHSKNKDLVFPSYMLYTCICLCSELMPYPQVSAEERVRQGLSEDSGNLLGIFSESYKSIPTSQHAKLRIGKLLALANCHLSNSTEHASDSLRTQMTNFALYMIKDCLINNCFESSEKTIICSESMQVVINLYPSESACTPDFMALVGPVIQTMLHCSIPEVLQVAARCVLELAEKGKNSEYLFESIVKPLFLKDGANAEQRDLCSAFLEKHSDQLSHLLPNLADRLLKNLDDILETNKSLDSFAKSFDVLLGRTSPENEKEASSLIEKIVTQHLFPEVHIWNVCHQDQIMDSYPNLLKSCYYTQDNEKDLYCILRSLSMASESCWNQAVKCLRKSILFSQKHFDRLYNNDTIEKLRSNRYAGLVNGGATCYMNATFQQIFMRPLLCKKLIGAPESDENSELFEALRNVMFHLAGGVASSADPSCFWRAFKDYDGNPVDVREHQDAYEFFTRLQDSVDEYLASLGHEKVMYSEMGGTFCQIIEVPGHDDLKSVREEEFYQISLDVSGKENLHQSLDSYVAAERLDGQNQWYCEALGRKVDAQKRTLIKKLPNTLVFHFKRFEWDFDTLSRWKIKGRFEFPIHLDMSQYIESEELSKGDPQYWLTGIIVHSGSAFAGHYYAYAKETGSGQWFCFDDTSVELWDINDVEKDCYGGDFVPVGSHRTYERNHSAYIVLYERQTASSESSNSRFFARNDVSMQQLDTMPERLRISLLEDNVKQICKMHVFSRELAYFFVSTAESLGRSVSGPRAVKVLKRTESDGGSRLFSTSDLFCSLDRRNGKTELPVAQSVQILLDYVCKILAAGPLGSAESSNQIQEAMKSILLSLKDSIKVSVASFSVVKYFCPIEGSEELQPIMTLASPLKSTREGLGELLVSAVLSLCESEQDQDFKKMLSDIMEALVLHIGTAMANYSSAYVKWEEMLSCLEGMSHTPMGRQSILHWIDEIVSYSEQIHEMWKSLPRSRRDAHVFGHSYSELVLPLLRMHQLEDDTERQGSPQQSSNPHILRSEASDSQCISGLPSQLISNSESLRVLILPGCAGNSLKDFLKWYMWEHEGRSVTAFVAILNHFQSDLVRLDDLACGVSSFVDSVTLNDSLLESRVEHILFGFESDSSKDSSETKQSMDTSDGTDYGISGIIDISLVCNNVMRAYLYFVMILEIRQKALGAWTKIFECRTNMARLSTWLASALECCLQFSRRLAQNRELRERWKSFIPLYEENLSIYFEPEVMMDMLGGLAGIEFSPSTGNTADDVADTGQVHSAGASLGLNGVVCIKAQEDQQSDDPDEVAEIDVEP